MGGGNMYFSEYNYDGSRKGDEPDPEVISNVALEPIYIQRRLVKEGKLKVLNDLKATLAPKMPEYRHAQESNYDRGMSHGLSTALNEIEKLVNIINKGE